MIKSGPSNLARCPVTNLSFAVNKDADDSLHKDPHRFVAPCQNDLRSPCPALNTLANHSYLPHDGRNISASTLYNALKEGFGVSTPLAFVLTYGGFFLLRQWGAITLADLGRHDCIEHDASLVHRNTYKFKEYAPHEVVPELVADLCDSVISLHKSQQPSVIGEEPTVPLMTAQDVGYLRHVRERSSPPLDPVHAEIARGEMAILLGAFAAKPRSPFTFQAILLTLLSLILPLLGLSFIYERLQSRADRQALLHGRNDPTEIVEQDGIPLDRLREFFLEETFPNGWRPARTTGLLETVYRSTMIREAYNKLGPIIPGADAGRFVEEDMENVVVLPPSASTTRSLSLSPMLGSSIHASPASKEATLDEDQASESGDAQSDASSVKIKIEIERFSHSDDGSDCDCPGADEEPEPKEVVFSPRRLSNASFDSGYGSNLASPGLDKTAFEVMSDVPRQHLRSVTV
jgi:hypothetical protein